MTQTEITILNELVAQRDRLINILALQPNSFFLLSAKLPANMAASVQDLLETKRISAETAVRAEIQARIDTINGKVQSIGVSNFPTSSSVTNDATS